MKKIKVSVIIPVYNGEKHIHSCIKSLQEQTLQEIEFIFVNDGSTDDTLEILSSYIKDERIKIFTQENKGVSAARNLGMHHAMGEFIGFLDADDIHKPNMHETLYKAAIQEDLDIVASNVLLQRDGKFISKKAHFQDEKVYFKKDIDDEIIPFLLCIEDPTLLSVCNKIFKREVIEQFNIKFDEEMKIEEDTLFNLMCLFYSEKIKFIDFEGYFHMDNPFSVTRDIFSNQIFDQVLIKFRLNYKKYLNLTISDHELFQFQCSRLIYSVNILVFKSISTKGLKMRKRNDFISNVIKNKDVINAVAFLHPNYKIRMRSFEKLITYCIKTHNIKVALFFTSFLSYIYNPKLSEFIRKFNK